MTKETSFVTNEHSFAAKQHSFAANETPFVAKQVSFAANEHSFVTKQHSFGANEIYAHQTINSSRHLGNKTHEVISRRHGYCQVIWTFSF